MPDTLISVVVPAFNSAQTVARAIDSAFAQTHRALQVIVVDDGSTDTTSEIVRACDRPIELIVQPNRGPAAARNAGAAAARGEFLAFLDADDAWHHGKLELQLNALRRYPSAAACFTRRVTQARGGPWAFDPSVNVGQPGVTEITDFRRIFLDPFFGTTTVLMPAAVFLLCGGFDETLETGEDIDLWLRAAYQRSVVRVDAVLAGVGYFGTSLTARVGERTYADSLRVLDAFVAAHPEFAVRHPRTVRAAKAMIRTNLASELLTFGQPRRAREVLSAEWANGTVSVRSLYLYLRSFLPAAARLRPAPIPD